jgi:Protein of unknown function (DUF3047)
MAKRRAAMERLATAARLCMTILTLSSTGLSEPRALSKIGEVPVVMATGVKQQADHGFQKVNLSIDFSDYSEGPLDEWLEAKGFRPEEEVKSEGPLELSSNEGSLILETKGRVRRFIMNEEIQLEKFSKIRIKWGIIKYPKDASYERKVNNEALMLYIFFGYNKLSSGHLAIPNLPYFIGLFLGKEDQINTPYEGKYFHQGGRFVCVGNPKPNETVITEFDLITAFQTYFGKDEVPMISGISLGVDTSSSGDEGKAAAYIQKIEFLE